MSYIVLLKVSFFLFREHFLRNWTLNKGQILLKFFLELHKSDKSISNFFSTFIHFSFKVYGMLGIFCVSTYIYKL